MEADKNNKKSKECVIKIYSKTEKEEKSVIKHFVYEYSKQKINCEFNENYIKISFKTSNLNDICKVFYRPPVKNAIKRSLLIYSLIYNRFFLYDADKKYEVIFDNEPCETENVFPVYSMGSQNANLDFNYKDGVLSNIMAIKESARDARLVALTDFIISKTKIFESERFLYLWMVMNGIYNYVWKKGNNEKGNESEQISYLAKIKNFKGTEFSREEKNHVFNWIRGYLYTELSDSSGCNCFKKSAYDRIEKYVWQETGKNEDGKAFVLFHFCYTLRCKLFHADTSAVLYCLGNDNDWKLLKTLNNMLETFLKEELDLVFNDDYLKA